MFQIRYMTKRARCETIIAQGLVTIAIVNSVDSRKKIIMPTSIIIKCASDLKCENQCNNVKISTCVPLVVIT